VPNHAKKIILVLDKKLRVDGFGIKPPGDGGYLYDEPMSGLTRIGNRYILNDSRMFFAKAYAAGFRACHIEYEV
jgi:hypothetical protein